MGYNLQIGELQVDITNDGRESIVNLTAETQNGRQESFLNVGELTDGTNMRWPTYTSWKNFTRNSDLYEFFFDKSNGLMRTHPGTFPLCEEHRKIVNEKYDEFINKYPNAQCTYETDNDIDATLVRFEWLKYWVNWALDNCKRPVFYNS